jgi:hypothetical protein
VRRPAPALLAAMVLLAACAEDDDPECPGERVAAFRFTGTLVAAADPAAAALDPVPATADCGPQLGYLEALPPMEGTLAADPSGNAAALCRPSGNVMFGQRSGLRFEVETGTTGAILGGCSPSCAAAMRLVITGDVLLDDEGAPRAFEGLLVEELRHVDGDCGSCLAPVEGSVPPRSACAARYAIVGSR